MNHVLTRVPERLQVTGAEAVHEHRRAGDVIHRVRDGDLLRQRRARLGRERFEIWDEQDRLHAVGKPHRLRHPLLPGVDRHLEPAVYRRRDVIRVPLAVRGELKQQLLRLRRREVLPREREPRGEAGDERRARRPQPARGRDAVHALEPDVFDRELAVGVDGAEPVLHGLNDRVRLVARQRVFALADNVHDEFASLEDELVLEVHREAEGVEPGAHVRARRGDGDDELLAVFQVDVLVLRELPIRGPLRLRFIPGGGLRSRRDADANARAARQPARQRRASTRGDDVTHTDGVSTSSTTRRRVGARLFRARDARGGGRRRRARDVHTQRVARGDRRGRIARRALSRSKHVRQRLAARRGRDDDRGARRD
mmetsp:Transcript_4062/g.14176  ORF Transcript_4062/g.14176 Transcript_4062/m.14176 type:complete len:369 (-) Transcript_4062:2578-3684(-)